MIPHSVVPSRREGRQTEGGGTGWSPQLLIAAIVATCLAAPVSHADIGHQPGSAAAGWAAYLEYSLAGDEKALERVEAALGETSFVAFEQAMLAGRRGDRVLMLERAERAVALDPENGEAQALLARAWFRLADEGLTSSETLGRAIAHAEAAVRLDAADPEIFDRLAAAHGALAMRAERAGDPETALRERGLERATLETWAERYRQEIAWRQLAELARELGDGAGEALALEEILRRGDDALLAAQRLGDVLAEIGRCESAIPVLEDALSRASGDKYAGISLAVQLGDCAARANEPGLSEAAFRRALELDPTNLIAVSGLAEALWSQGRRDEAVAAMDTAGERLSEDAAARSLVPIASRDVEQRLDWLATRARWKAAHDIPEALDDARKALALSQASGTPRQRALMGALVAEAFLGRGDTASAIDAAREAVSQDPSHEASLVTLLNATWGAGERQAVTDLVSALEKKASGAAWFSRVARWEAARSFDDAARRHAKKALDAFDGPPGARATLDVEIGSAFLLAGDPASAEVLARHALRIRPWDDDAAFLHAESLFELGRGSDAEAVLDGHLAARGEDPWLLERLSQIDEAHRRSRSAVTRAERAIELLLSQSTPHPSAIARLETRLGEALIAARRPREAADVLERAVGRSHYPPPERVGALARALQVAGDADRALAALAPTLQRVPDDDGLLGEKGRLQLMSGRIAEGTATLLGLLEDPRALAGRHGQVALALAHQGQHGAAQRVADEALTRFPRHAGLLVAASRVSETAGRRDEAEARLRSALRLEPDSPVILNALGYSLADWNTKVEEAVRLLRRAVEARPNEAAYLDSLGWALFRVGKHDEAARLLEAGLARDRDPVILAHLGHVRRAQGRMSEAADLLREALAAGLDEGEESAREALEGLGVASGAPGQP